MYEITFLFIDNKNRDIDYANIRQKHTGIPQKIYILRLHHLPE